MVKIGRNDYCPCGSGKKYKRCCYPSTYFSNKETSFNSFSSCPDSFPKIPEIASALREPIKKYRFEDVVVAAFCFNSWRINRSAQMQALALNMALCDYASDGSVRIDSYKDLESFYNVITRYLSDYPFQDYVIDDYGEVFIEFEGVQYSVITGSGYQQVYSALRFMSTLAKLNHYEQQMASLLKYIDFTIQHTKDSNLSNHEERIVYELPSEAYWNDVRSLFRTAEFTTLLAEASKAFKDYGCPIERRHFVIQNSVAYPLFNPSILIDYYDILLTDASTEIIKAHIENTILTIIENSFNAAQGKRSHILIKPRILDARKQQIKLVQELLFAGRDQDRVVVALIARDSLAATTKTIETINQLHQNDTIHIVEGFRRDGTSGNYGWNINSDIRVTYILIDPHTKITSEYMSFGERNEEFKCTALDIVEMIGFSENISEILDYIEYDRNSEATVLAFTGKSSMFFTWKSSHQVLSTGAIEYGNITLDFNLIDEYIYAYFRDKLKNFPRNGNQVFLDPLNWIIKEEQSKHLTLIHKSNSLGGTVITLSKETYVFLAHNADFLTREDLEANSITLFHTIDDLNLRLINRFGSMISKLPILIGATLQFLFIPWHYAQVNFTGIFSCAENGKYVFCDEFLDNNHMTILYTVQESLLSAISEAHNRSVENEYFLELFEPLRRYCENEFAHMEQTVKNDSSNPKTVDVAMQEIDYYFPLMETNTTISARSFVRARKEIAQVSLSCDLHPGNYYGKDATLVVRKMQETIVKVFEHYISAYDKSQLHGLALSYYAVQLHGINMHLKRYRTFTELESTVQLELDEKTRSEREDYKRYARTAEYLIESNLAVHHTGEEKQCTSEDFDFLLAFADWLVVLQDNADICYHTDKDVSFSIGPEYNIDTFVENNDQIKFEDWIRRKYESEDYALKSDKVDEQFIEKICEAFQRDTGISLPLLLDFLTFMQLVLVRNGNTTETYPNVFEINSDILIKKYLESLDEDVPELENVKRVLDFIILDETKLKTIKGRSLNILPIWERENRDQRFNIRPVLVHNGICTFSPTTIHSLKSQWRDGIYNWQLPYEIGLPHVQSVLVEWKKRYEDSMVHDIAEVFRNAQFSIVEAEVDLASRFPHAEYPEELGDYDVIAVNEEAQEIWIIESKVLKKVGSIYEDQMQQKSFFIQHKDDEKFQRRINFFTLNIEKIAKSFKMLNTNYQIIPYMVTNKLFVSKYKKIDFPIITYHELKMILIGQSETSSNEA